MTQTVEKWSDFRDESFAFRLDEQTDRTEYMESSTDCHRTGQAVINEQERGLQLFCQSDCLGFSQIDLIELGQSRPTGDQRTRLESRFVDQCQSNQSEVEATTVQKRPPAGRRSLQRASG